MKAGNGMVLATSPNLLIKPKFGEVVHLPATKNFIVGEYVWVIFTSHGGISRIDKLDDDHLHVPGPEDKLVEVNKLSPEDTVSDDWDSNLECRVEVLRTRE